MDRRDFLQIMGLFSSATLLSSCGSEDGQKKLISYLVPPEEGVLPGAAVWLPGTCTECPAGCGLSIRIREGRPVKLEGIPDHPVSRGGLCVRGQSSLWRLYHPERLRQPQVRDEQGNWRALGWEEAFVLIEEALERSRAGGKASVYLSGRTTGTLGELIDRFCSGLEIERHPEFELLSHGSLRQANQTAFGIADIPYYRIDQADLLISIGADLLETFVNPVGQGAQLGAAREKRGLRWYHLEPHASLTGFNADRRLVLRAGSEGYLLTYLLRQLHDTDRVRRALPETVLAALPRVPADETAERTGLEKEELEKLVEELAVARSPLLIVGGTATGLPGGVRTALLGALLQWCAGMPGSTIDFGRRQNYAGLVPPAALGILGRRLEQGSVGVLFVSRFNPPTCLQTLGSGLGKAEFRVGLTDFLDETADAFDLVLPLSHALESWGDAMPRAGVRTLIRPAIKPLHDSLSEGEILLGLLQRRGLEKSFAGYQEFLFSRWQSRYSQQELERLARTGYLEEEIAEASPSLAADGCAEMLRKEGYGEIPQRPILVVTPSIRTYDGRSRVIPLLAEIPDPLTTVSYGGWVSLSPADAEKRGIKDRDPLRLTLAGGALRLPARIQPGLAEGVLNVQVDHFPLSRLRMAGEEFLLTETVEFEKDGQPVPLPILSGSPSQHGRGIIPDPVHLEERRKHPQASLYPEHDHPDYRWAMAIDLQRCIGCSACVAACYIENNVPVVGPREHIRGREMSWLRIEPFYDAEGLVGFLPMLCQHCHSAPCEPVCPVYAAYHNMEGINVQVYARCVGTRYCSNNCPYKVRRFNWWAHKRPAPLDRMTNPDVPVRTRGIMEKCTFCLQRIRLAGDAAKDEGRKIEDGEVVTACAQSCPTAAITFGNLLDENSRVYRLAHTERAYRVFEELGTKTAIFYLR